jgi:Glucodextranase, domain B/PASTA domain
VYPPTDASCASFTDSGVHYERTIRQSDGGLQVTIVDRWKSVDGKAHTLDAIYQDSARSENSAIAGREGRQNFMWTQDGFATHLPNTLIPLPASVPATMLVKTDGSTPDSGDNTNPIGAMVFGSTPSELRWTKPGDAMDKNAYWETRYQRTIPAGGEVSIAVGYAHDLTLTPVKSKAAALQTALTAPSVGIDSPADGSTIDAASAHVTGTAASVDGQATVTVNGVWAIVGSDGQWSADVPLSEGSNQIVAVASNRIGVTTTASVSVNRPAAPAAPAAATGVVAAKPIRCVVPRLRGKTLTTAKRLLKRAHCRLGKVVHKASTRVKPGRIVATRFKAGTRHPAGSRVRVTVATKARRR